MSFTRSPAAAPNARQVKSVLKGAAASLSGKKRGADGAVRRNSYDVDDNRAKPWRPIGDGTVTGALDWIDALMKTAREYDRMHKKPGQRGGGLGGPFVITVLEALLGRRGTIGIDFKSGRLDPALDTLQRVTGFARGTIVRALAKLKEHGFLSWVRRSQKTGKEGELGPQREQASNAYYFDLKAMNKAVRQRLRDLINARRRRRDTERAQAAPAALAATEPATAQDPALAAVLERVRALVDNASSPNALYQASGVKG
ncbi:MULTISPECIES: hypothetical protein [unclassified Sphingomonas]|uniref:hypothetical protein n=1 Tax=unclassified Sphingomonas TaxID=196159 RepID=UPI002269C589|nr:MULTISPECIES: hypothetical protein [unclassified Sphingomonas]